MPWAWVSEYDYKKVHKKNKKGGDWDHGYWNKKKYYNKYKRWQDEDEWDDEAENENDDEDAEWNEPQKRPRPPLEPPRQERETTEEHMAERKMRPASCTAGVREEKMRPAI